MTERDRAGELLYDGSPRCPTCPPRSRTSCIVGGCENPQPDRAPELALAEAGMRSIARSATHPLARTGAIEAIRDDVVLIMQEYDRRGELLAALMDGLSPWLRDGEPPAPGDDEIRASVDQMNEDFTEASNGWALGKAALDRSQAVVDAARALVEGWSERRIKPRVELDERWVSPQLDQRLDALAREVHALEGEQS
jgi:hypothetical protein